MKSTTNRAIQDFELTTNLTNSILSKSLCWFSVSVSLLILEVLKICKGFLFLRLIMINGKQINELPYTITKDGMVTSLKSGKNLKPHVSGNGYKMLNLSVNGKRYWLYVHRVLAEAFIANPSNKQCVNHKDGDKLNNDLSNLEWCSYSENLTHAYQNKLNKKPRAVESISLSSGEIKRYPSARAAEADGFTNQLIAKCCKNIRKTHKGYKWRYLDGKK